MGYHAAIVADGDDKTTLSQDTVERARRAGGPRASLVIYHRDQVKVMVTVELPRKILRAESRRNKALEAVDRAIEKLEPQLKKYKEMLTGKDRARRERRLA